MVLQHTLVLCRQAGEVTQLPQCPGRFLPSMLYELVHYSHLVLSAIVITFVTIIQLGFILHAFIHSESTFLCTCVITFLYQYFKKMIFGQMAFACTFADLQTRSSPDLTL